jgi:integrase
MPKVRTKNYTEPQISPKNANAKKMGVTWFVWCRFRDESEENPKKQWKQKIFKGTLNDIPDFRERLKKANSIRQELAQMLEEGFNPLSQEFEKPETVEQNPFEKYSFSEAIDFAITKCSVSSATLKAYKQTARYCKDAARRLTISKMLMKDIKKQHIKLILEEAKKKSKWSNKAYNKHLGYLQAILSRLDEWEIIEINPAHGIKNLPVVESEMYVPYTDEERERIKEYLYIHHYRFFVFIFTIYSTGIRPKELLALKIKDINIDKNIITIYPELDKENSKTKSIRKVPISKPLLPFFREMELHKYNKEYYVFGSPYTSGRGNSGSAKTSNGQAFGVMHPEYFKPSEVMIKRDTVTKLWKKLIIDGLGINKHLYAAKASGGVALIKAGVSLDAIQAMFGHQTKKQTEHYIKMIKDVYKEEIVNNAPGF